MKRDNIILSFDLDFTLINNREGILNSFKYALNKYDLPNVDDESIEEMIGIPLNDMFSKFTSIDPSILSRAFREYYGREGIYQVKLISGAREKLLELKKNSFVLGVITSKKQEMAIKLLKFLELDSLFNYIIGENESIKSKLDPELKKILHSTYPNHHFVIIGDHPKDRMLSEMLNCPFIGVLTGTHSKPNLKRNGDKKHLIFKSVRDITPEHILSLFD